MPLSSELIGPDYRIDRAWAALRSAVGLLGMEAGLVVVVTVWFWLSAGSAFVFSWVWATVLLLVMLGSLSFVWGGLYRIAVLARERFGVERKLLQSDGGVLLGAGAIAFGALTAPVIGFAAWSALLALSQGSLDGLFP